MTTIGAGVLRARTTRLILAILTGVLIVLVAAPRAHAATCADYPNQAAAQAAADTRDADGDGIYCESLPCPCSTAAGGGGGGGGGGPVSPPPAAPPSSKASRWHSPSKNISCRVGGGKLRCSIRSVDDAATTPCARDGETLGYRVGPRGRAGRDCLDPYRVLGVELAYGTTWKRAGIVCSIEKTGVRCLNRSQHGFFISRQRHRIL